MKKHNQVYLQEFSKNSHEFPADVPLIVQFVIYSLQNLLVHLAYHFCDTAATYSTGEIHESQKYQTLQVSELGNTGAMSN
jgi:hypothetical protein